eukprot:6039825-Alexandrium_andersonii.AAC.1
MVLKGGGAVEGPFRPARAHHWWHIVASGSPPGLPGRGSPRRAHRRGMAWERREEVSPAGERRPLRG